MLLKNKEEILLKTPVFDVVEKSFENIDFKPVGLNCKDWVMVLAVDSTFDPMCVFVRQTRWGAEEKTIEFPCGTVEDNELPEDAARREFLEETGINLDNYLLEHIISFNPNPAYFSNQMHVFKVVIPNLENIFSNRSKQNLDKDEDCEVFINLLRNEKFALSSHNMGLISYLLLR